MRIYERLAGIVVIANLLLAAPGFILAQTSPKRDAQNAGSETKQAAKDTGKAAKDAAKKTGHATKRLPTEQLQKPNKARATSSTRQKATDTIRSRERSVCTEI